MRSVRYIHELELGWEQPEGGSSWGSCRLVSIEAELCEGTSSGGGFRDSVNERTTELRA